MTTLSVSGVENLRQRGAEAFRVLGYPTSRNEDWKFTSVAPIGQVEWQAAPAGAESSLSASALEPFRMPMAVHELVFLNGRFSPSLSSVGSLPEGVTVTSLAQAFPLHGEVVESVFGTIADFERHAFTALNTSLWADGACVVVPPGTRLDRPIHLLFLTDSIEKVASYPRNLVIAGASAEGSIIETYGSVHAARYFTNAVTEILVGPNARLEHVKLQREDEQAYHVGTIEVRQERDSRFRSFSFAIGGALARTNIYSVMDGEGAVCTMNGLYMLHGKQHIDHQTRIEHAFPNCSSREVYKGILDGESHGVFNGKVYVRPEAQKTDGKQTNKNLLLSDTAKVDTKPQLEIFADDVKCTHGATVGRLDDISLFYLESRGISAAQARRLLTYGFATEVLEEIEEEPLRHQLERLVFQRLDGSVR